MAKYRVKMTVEATQWFKVGDHDRVEAYLGYYEPDETCKRCGHKFKAHGWIEDIERSFLICPGDWVIIGHAGNIFTFDSAKFEENYERITDDKI